MGYAVQAAIGLVAIGFAARRPRPPKDGASGRAAAVRTARQAFVLSVTVTAVEATTALPYLGAMTLIVRADGTPLADLALLVAYNVVFITPPVLVPRWARGGTAASAGGSIAPVSRRATAPDS